MMRRAKYPAVDSACLVRARFKFSGFDYERLTGRFPCVVRPMLVCHSETNIPLFETISHWPNHINH